MQCPSPPPFTERRWLLACALIVVARLAVAGFDAHSSRGMDLSGHWKLNETQSDDAEALLQERLERERKEQERMRSRARRDMSEMSGEGPGEADARSADSEPRGGAFANRSRESWRKEYYDDLRQMMGISGTLDIEQSGTAIHMRSRVDSRRFEAGSRSQVSLPQGELADSNVGWDGEWFVVDRRVRGGPRIVEKYRVVNKTGQLQSVTKFSGDSPLAGIKVQRFYDRTEDPPPRDPELGPVR